MSKPKIMFRDFSSQHVAALLPICDEMLRQGFDCEVQQLAVPRENELDKWSFKHMNDKFDLLLTTSISEWIFAPRHVSDRLQRTTKGRKKAIFMFHSVGPEEQPTLHHLEFKSIFIAGQFYWAEYTKPYTLEVICKYCGKAKNYGIGETAERYAKKLKLQKDWYCKNRGKKYCGKSIHDHVKWIERKNSQTPLKDTCHLIGYPKVDVLSSPKRFKIARKLSNELDLPFDKTVLWTPTLKRVDDTSYIGMDLLKIFETLEINLLIKTHCDDEDKDYQPKLYHQIKSKAIEMKNVRWLDPLMPTITPYFLIANTLISGSSGGLVEFMVTDRPSIQLRNPAWKNIEKGDEDRYIYRGCVQSDISELRKNILRVIYVPETMQKERRENVSHFIHKPDGHATDRAISKIKELMGW